MSSTCGECGAKCCRYFCFEIDAPDTYEEFDDIRWFLLHEGITVHVDEKGDWYISIDNRCKALGRDNGCRIYEDRPLICRKYTMDGCDHTGGDYGYREMFSAPEDIDRYAREVLGEKVFESKRARARAAEGPAKKAGRRGKSAIQTERR